MRPRRADAWLFPVCWAPAQTVCPFVILLRWQKISWKWDLIQALHLEVFPAPRGIYALFASLWHDLNISDDTLEDPGRFQPLRCSHAASAPAVPAGWGGRAAPRAGVVGAGPGTGTPARGGWAPLGDIPGSRSGCTCGWVLCKVGVSALRGVPL